MDKLVEYLIELEDTRDVYTPEDMDYRQGQINAVKHCIELLKQK